MSAVPTPYPQPRIPRRAVAVRFAAMALVAVFAAGAMVFTSEVGALPASAAESALTVSWVGDSSSAAEYQPDRLPSSPHYEDFDSLEVTVSQTSGIVDQTIRVSVSGFAQTRSATQSSNDITADDAMNFVQAMQCWGPDPLADDFNETCQWGGRYGEGGGLGTSVVLDNAARVGPLDLDLAHPRDHDVPFRTSGGSEVSGKPRIEGAGTVYPILSYFGPSTTNEVTSARIGADGSGYFDFETQSANTASHLGCGSAARSTCWLVIVPRGTHFGGDGAECSGVLDKRNDNEPYEYGQGNAIQGGSPVNDECDYFDNRLVIPLEFSPTRVTCEVGSTETRVVGSQLMTAAMSSWQPALCESLKSTFSFATNADAVARAQLLETGANSPGIAFTGYPVSSGELLSEFERTQLAKTKLTYVPVGISAVVVGFISEVSGGRQESLVMSPRLLAKYLTQSYPFLVPQATSAQGRNATHLGAVNQTYTRPYQDPEFQLLNPSNYNEFQYPPALVLPGANADAIKQVWRWILADADAKAFLEGTADPWGMKVNPYYLPKSTANVIPWYLSDAGTYLETETTKEVGLTNLDGTPRKLTDLAMDSFPKYDRTLMPLQLNGERSRFDSIQFSPYAESLVGGARQAFRADSRAKVVWDPNVINAAGEKGDWTSAGPQLPGQRFMIVVTDSVSAARWGLSQVAVTAPGTKVTTTTDPAAITTVTLNRDSMASALSALEATSLDSVKQINPAKVASGGWPLTMVTYAGVNLSKSTPAARSTIADMLKQVTQAGQTPGTGLGELPIGYLPLTGGLQAQAALGVLEIRSWVAPRPTTAPTNGPAQDDYELASPTPTGDEGADPELTPGADELSDDRTAATSTGPVARSALVIALIIGVAGFVAGPILFRGRRLP